MGDGSAEDEQFPSVNITGDGTIGRAAGRGGNVDRADMALDVAMGVAARGGDLEEALRELLHICAGRRDVVEAALARCTDAVALDGHDLTALRAIELLNGALRTPLFASLPR
ncbi:MAG: hypothetical protein JWL83_1524 [Actinomycetia bacterium]|nr:hypothetical protein [Actinomycetes bacterium]